MELLAPAFALGLLGSLGHCVGMCSGVAMLLSQKLALRGWRMAWLHAGRLTTYAALGAVLGGAGQVVVQQVNHAHHVAAPQPVDNAALLASLQPIQTALAVLAGLIAIYMALAMLGRAPSPEMLLKGLTQRWGRAMRQLPAAQNASPVTAFGAGLLWGLLPCGLVLSALVMAGAAGTLVGGGAAMFAFGAGTLPATLGLGLLGRLRVKPNWARTMRPLAATLMLMFGAQFMLRGLASGGWIEHLHLGGLMLW